MNYAKKLTCGITLALVSLVLVAVGQELTPLEQLGMQIYFDTNLSTPPGQACASCHDPGAGFADPDQDLPVSQGVIPHRFGNRNSPTSAYAAFSPDFHYDEVEEMYIGGQFWDGRALDLVEQAKGPFLNPLEMNNRNKITVIKDIYRSDYADLFREVFGEDIFGNIDAAYDSAAVAIAAFEETSELNQFTSKYDYYLAGQVELTEQEMMGLELFNDPGAGNCAACHPSEPGPYNDQALFTDYSYDNLGIPKNWENPFLYLPPAFNPEGEDFIDYGLGNTVGEAGEMGKFKVSTLRNIAVTAPYGHNGFFQSLGEIVNFYNTRDVPGAGWAPPEVPENVNTEELGDLGLTEEEEDAIVAFLMTLTDGYMVDAGLASAGSEAEFAFKTPANLEMLQNYPNPFNPETSIRFTLPEAARVKLEVYDASGRLVATLLNRYAEAGNHQVTFSGSGLASGIYLARIQAGDMSQSLKMLLVK